MSHHHQGLLQQQLQEQEQAERMQGHHAALTRQLAMLQRQNQLAADAATSAAMPFSQIPFAQPEPAHPHPPPQGYKDEAFNLTSPPHHAWGAPTAPAATVVPATMAPHALLPLMAQQQQQQQQQQQLEPAPLGALHDVSNALHQHPGSVDVSALRDVSNTLHQHPSSVDVGGKPLTKSGLSKALSDSIDAGCMGPAQAGPLGSSTTAGCGSAGSPGGSLGGLSMFDSGRLSSGLGGQAAGGSASSCDGSVAGEPSSTHPVPRTGSPLFADTHGGAPVTATCLGSGSIGAQACMDSLVGGARASPRVTGSGDGDGCAGLAGSAEGPAISAGVGAPSQPPLSLEALSLILSSCRHDPAALAQVLSRMALEAQAQAIGSQPAHSPPTLQRFAPLPAPAYPAEDVFAAGTDQQLPQRPDGTFMGFSNAMHPSCHSSDVLKGLGMSNEQDEAGLSTLTPDLLPLLQEIWNR